MAFSISYTTVVWTAGDVITEAKMDAMVANDQAYDAHSTQGLEFTGIATPSNPAATKVRVYAKTDGYLYTLDSSGNERQLGAASTSSGGGGVNGLINGAFDVWELGTTFTTPNDDTYGPDQWNFLADSNGSWTFSQSTDVPSTGGSLYSLKAVNVTANKQCGIVQFLDKIDAAKFIGGTVSLSFYAKTTSAKVISNLRCSVLSWSSTADAITSDVIGTWAGAGTDPTFATNWTKEVAGANKALTTSWQQFKVENVAIDTASTANIAVVIWVDDTTITANDEFYVTQVALSAGATALTTYPYEEYTEVQNRCRRFLQKCTVDSTNGAQFPAFGIAKSTTQVTYTFFFPCRMRSATPTFSNSTISGFNFYVDDSVGAVAITGFTQTFATSNGATLTATVAAGLTQYRPALLSSGSGSDNYLLWSAQL